MNKHRLLIILFVSFVFLSCSKDKNKNTEQVNISQNVNPVKHKIEFIELGSVNCIPCKKMQPIMKSIEQKYKGLVKVTFYDVWKDDAPAKKYGITLIPTQVFLDENGKEIMRHEGFFPEEDIDRFFKSQGVNIPQ